MYDTRRKLVSVVLLAAVRLLAPSVTLAQAQPDTVTLPPIVVTATLVPMRVEEVSATVTVLSGDLLRARGLTTLADALRTVPGAAIATTGSFGGQTSLFLRGGESDYVKVLIDGVPQNQPGGFIDFANLGIEDVDRVEIVRGPASVLYGSDAVTGVIQIFTRAGRGAFSGRLSAGGGGYGTRWGTFGLDGTSGIMSYSATVSRRTTDGIYPVNNRYQRDLVSAQTRFRPDSRTEVSVTARWSGNTFHFPTDFTGLVSDSNQYTSTRGPSIGVEAARALLPSLGAHVLVVGHGERNVFDDRPDNPADTGASCCFHGRDDIRRTMGRGWLDLRLADGAVVTGGVEIEHQHQDGTSLIAARHDAAGFAQVMGRMMNRGAFTLGARLDQNEEYGRHLTGRAGLTWRLAPETRVRASVGTGFKEPSFYENFASGFVHGNPALRPERSTSWEVALEQAAVSGRLVASVVYFAQRFRDLIQYSPVPLGADSVNYANVASATARGVELSIRGVVHSGVTLDGSFTRTRARDEATGEALLRRPLNSGTVQLAWASRWGRILLDGVFIGDRSDIDYGGGVPAPVWLTAYTRVDVGVEFRLWPPPRHRAGQGLVASLRIQNLLDASIVETTGFRSPGRMILVGGEMRLGH
jgi:vitamin B12 transporter